MMTTLAQEHTGQTQRIINGSIAGVAGGVVFGAMMAGMGMLPMVAGLVGSTSAVVGFIVHIVISAIIGAGFGVVAGRYTHSYGHGAGLGLAYGAVWWVLGPLMLMPLMMGMGLHFSLAFTAPRLMSLGGHLVYGLVTGLAYVWFSNR
jgi:uncharacterized membrane protein YagU involved in acid resistance